MAEPESESATIAQSNEESTSQIDEQNSEPVSQSGNVQTEKPNGNVSQAQKPVNNTTTTTKQHSGNTVTTTKINSGNGGSAVNTCKHSWKLDGYGAGNYVYICTKCGDYKSEEHELNPNDFPMGNKSEYLELLGYVNKARREAGLNEVKYFDIGQEGANTRAKELLISYSHTRPNGKSGASAVGECIVNAKITNLAAGSEVITRGETAKNAFNSWMNSPNHKKIILSEGASYIVAARCHDCWVMINVSNFYD